METQRSTMQPPPRKVRAPHPPLRGKARGAGAGEGGAERRLRRTEGCLGRRGEGLIVMGLFRGMVVGLGGTVWGVVGGGGGV